MKTLFSIAIIACVLSFTGKAQTSLNSSGIAASGTGGKVAATIGQVVFQTESSPLYYLIQGVQQPFEISVITSNAEYTDRLNLNVFPNPTTNGVTLSIDIADFRGLNFIMYDLNGKPTQMNSITSNEFSISMEGKPDGTYFLKVFDKNTIVKVFKIVKM